MMCPAVTRVSLFARAISFPASMAAIVGLIPIMPTTAVTNTCASGITAISSSPSIPVTTFTGRSATRLRRSAAASSLHIPAINGWNSRICCSICSTLFPAASATTCSSGLFLTTSRVWVPIEPVDPRIAIFFMYFRTSIRVPSAKW